MTILTDTRTPAEIAYDALKDGTAYRKLSPDAIRTARESALETIADGFDDDEREEAVNAILSRYPDASESFRQGLLEGYLAGKEMALTMKDAGMYEPVPPVPTGYATDRAGIWHDYGNVMVSVDRRDGEMLICGKGKANAETVIIKPDYAIAVFQFFRREPIIELMHYHWCEQLRQTGNPELLDWVDGQFPDVAAAYDRGVEDCLKVLEQKLAERLETRVISTKRLYQDPTKGNDLTDESVGPLAYVDYECGQEDTWACVSHDLVRGTVMVELRNGDLISLDDARQYCHNLQAILADPRVKALRAA